MKIKNLFEIYSVRELKFLVFFEAFLTIFSHDLFVTHLTHLQWRHSTRCCYLNVSQTLLVFMFSWLKVLPLPQHLFFPFHSHRTLFIIYITISRCIPHDRRTNMPRSRKTVIYAAQWMHSFIYIHYFCWIIP